MDHNLLTALLTRRSFKPKLLGAPAPGIEQLELCARAALRAPVHGKAFPCRFVLIPEEQREHLSELFRSAAERQGADEEKQHKAASKAFKGPQIVAFVVCFSENGNKQETLISAGAALQQFLLALKALGYGAITLSGSILDDEQVQEAFRTNASESVLAWITIGSPADQSESEPETGQPPFSIWKQ